MSNRCKRGFYQGAGLSGQQIHRGNFIGNKSVDDAAAERRQQWLHFPFTRSHANALSADIDLRCDAGDTQIRGTFDDFPIDIKCPTANFSNASKPVKFKKLIAANPPPDR